MCQNCESRTEQGSANSTAQAAAATAKKGQQQPPVMIVTGATRVNISALAGLKGALSVADRVNGIVRSDTRDLALAVVAGAGMASEGALRDYIGGPDSEEFLRAGTVKAFASLLRLAADQGLQAHELMEATRALYEGEVNAEVKASIVADLRDRGMFDPAAADLAAVAG